MLTEIGTALSSIITWIGSCVTALVSSSGAWYALLPLFALGCAVTIVMLGIRVIRSFTYGA